MQKRQSAEGVILRIKGKELKMLGYSIYADWNKPYRLKRNSKGELIDVDYDTLVLSVVLECDIPLEYLNVARRVPIKRH